MDDRRPEVFGVTLAMFIFATVVVILRFISCIAIVRKVAMHDYLMLVAWVWKLLFSRACLVCWNSGANCGSFCGVDSGLWVLLFNMLRNYEGVWTPRGAS